MTTLGRRFRWATAALALLLVLTACNGDDDDGDAAPTTSEEGTGGTEITLIQDGGTLDAILERGSLRCGTRDALPGFAVLTPEGDHVGFDADFCRVIAAAILGDA